jgi:hypothetical protein
MTNAQIDEHIKRIRAEIAKPITQEEARRFLHEYGFADEQGVFYPEYKDLEYCLAYGLGEGRYS